jgi:formylglycine-generating enzyme required for sulfatase activity
MTQGQWLRLVGKNPSGYAAGGNVGGKIIDLRHPVEQVSWDDCEQWLSRLALLLPTEAQWEYGARGGTTTPRWTGIGTEGLSKAANLADQFARLNGGPAQWRYEPWTDGYTAHAPVGSFEANPFGLHDVIGNVTEWSRDRSGMYDVKPGAGDGLRTQPRSVLRVMRGGDFHSDSRVGRSAHRGFNAQGFRGFTVGVRPIRPLDP